MQAFSLIGFGLVILFLILNLIRRDKDRSTLFLLAFFFLVGCELMYRYMLASGMKPASGFLIGFDLTYWILLGPAIYGYSRSLLFPDQKLTWRSAIHLVPFCIVMIPYNGYLLSGTGTISFFTFAYRDNFVYRMIIQVFWEYLVLVYLVVTMIMIIKNRNILDCFFSSRRRKNLNWLIYLNGGFAAHIVIASVFFLLADYGIIDQTLILREISGIILVIYLLGIGVFGYRQEGIFSAIRLTDISNARISGKISPEIEREFKYRKSGLQDQEITILLSELNRIMKSGQPWVNCNLNIQDLAKQLNTSVHKLSRVINEHFGKNFFDYINSYRLAAVKKMLGNPVNNDQKIMAIAYDCGFNSKSAFYAIFRKNTGMSPIEFRMKNQPERSAVFSN